MSTRKIDLEVTMTGMSVGATKYLGEVTLGGQQIFTWSGDRNLYYTRYDAEEDLVRAFTDRLAEVLAE